MLWGNTAYCVKLSGEDLSRCLKKIETVGLKDGRMWANAKPDGRPAKYRWHPVLNAAKFGLRPLLDCRAVTLPIGERKT